MNNTITSLMLLSALLFQSLWGGGALLACHHKDSGLAHISYLHTDCPLSSESGNTGIIQPGETNAGQSEAECVDIVLDFFALNCKPGQSLSDSFQPLFAFFSSSIRLSSISPKIITSRNRAAETNFAASYRLIGTVILVC